jgi:hypothetical protein
MQTIKYSGRVLHWTGGSKKSKENRRGQQTTTASASTHNKQQQVSIHHKKCSKLVVRKISPIPKNRCGPIMHKDLSRKGIYMEDEQRQA